MDCVVVVEPTGYETSLHVFKHHYESKKWCIAEATCVKHKLLRVGPGGPYFDVRRPRED